MSKKNKIILIGLLLLIFIIIAFGALFKNSKSKNNILPNQTQAINNQMPNINNNKLILYYGEGCPHCANVENYLKSNPLKITLEQKEVYYNKTNQQDLLSKAKICNIPQNRIGVPFLWTGKDCILGDQPIINYFKNSN